MQEAVLDLGVEQVLSPALTAVNNAFVQTMIEHGIPIEAIVTELVLSGEVERTYRLLREVGYAVQSEFHSPTWQYGQLTRRGRYDHLDFLPTMRELADDIESGRFADEWDAERDAGYPTPHWRSRSSTRARRCASTTPISVGASVAACRETPEPLLGHRGVHHGRGERHDEAVIGGDGLQPRRGTSRELGLEATERRGTVRRVGEHQLDRDRRTGRRRAMGEGTNDARDELGQLCFEQHRDVRGVDGAMDGVELAPHLRVRGDHVEDRDAASRPADASHLAKGLLVVGEVVHGAPTDDDVERVVDEGEGVRVSLLEEDVRDP